MMEVAQLGGRVPAEFHFLPYGFRPAIELAVGQSGDGVWNGSMLSMPPRSSPGFDGVIVKHRTDLEVVADRVGVKLAARAAVPGA